MNKLNLVNLSYYRIVMQLEVSDCDSIWFWILLLLGGEEFEAAGGDGVYWHDPIF